MRQANPNDSHVSGRCKTTGITPDPASHVHGGCIVRRLGRTPWPRPGPVKSWNTFNQWRSRRENVKVRCSAARARPSGHAASGIAAPFRLGQALLRPADRETDPARDPSVDAGTRTGHSELYRHRQRRPATLSMDQVRRRHPGHNQTLLPAYPRDRRTAEGTHQNFRIGTLKCVQREQRLPDSSLSANANMPQSRDRSCRCCISPRSRVPSDPPTHSACSPHRHSHIGTIDWNPG